MHAKPVILPRNPPIIVISKRYLGPWYGREAVITVCDPRNGRMFTVKKVLSEVIRGTGSVKVLESHETIEHGLRPRTRVMVAVYSDELADICEKPRLAYYTKPSSTHDRGYNVFYITVSGRRIWQVLELYNIKPRGVRVSFENPDTGYAYRVEIEASRLRAHHMVKFGSVEYMRLGEGRIPVYVTVEPII